MGEQLISYLWLVQFFPLVGVILNGLLGKMYGNKFVSWVGCSTIGLSFLVSFIFLMKLINVSPDQRYSIEKLFFWIATGKFAVEAGLVLDPLSAVMIMVVTGVGFVIHIYSVGYMHNDPGYARYFAYLNLFIFSMLILVMADSFLFMFFGWEGVGLCSYLLIGFWYEDKKNTDAGVKAFIVNRIGDFGFLVGLFLIYKNFGSLEFDKVFLSAANRGIGNPDIVAITLLLFMGAIGKSAQIPLYVWLPDAMQGPTPVSALIHAATMVTAGVYMISRCYILYLLAPFTMEIIAIVGVITAIYSASIGIVQNDIKRVLAYSTISQIGFMFLAVGVGAFSSGMFHLMTHAFFKGLLFLGAGSVIHSLSGEQDIRFMGGLKNYIPVTFWTFLVAVLAITGIPGFSGFFSKDEILWNAFSRPEGSPVLWFIAILCAGITSFYIFRLFYLVFLGESRIHQDKLHHIHKSPPIMTIPLIILAFFSFIGGYIGLPHSLGGKNSFEEFLKPIFGFQQKLIKFNPEEEFPLSLEYFLMLISILIILIGWSIVHNVYLKKPETAERMANRFPNVYKLLFNKYYVDEIYHKIIVNPFMKISDVFWKIFDVKIVDGAVNLTAQVILSTGDKLKRIQTGYIQEYALSLILGAVIIIGYFIFR